MKYRGSMVCFFLILICAGVLLGRMSKEAVGDAKGTGASARENGTASRVIVEGEAIVVAVDAGHGGSDPGKIGVDEAKEKDINLSIAKLVQGYLEEKSIEAVMTREKDQGLYTEGASNKKAEDMRRRIEILEESQADLLVSIHQNSFTQSQYTGAQVFYFTGSKEGEQLAKLVQQSLIDGADPDNHREAKANSDYYMLKKSPVPAIICECGFLSNAVECEKLQTPQYQEKIARSIVDGILKYLQISGIKSGEKSAASLWKKASPCAILF